MFRIAIVLVAVATAGNPVGKVLELLNTLEGRIKEEGEVETKQYEEYAEWCDDQTKEKNYEIKTGTAQSADLGATIEQATGQVITKTTEIEEIATVIAANEGDLKAASDIRTKEHQDFAAEEQELVETIDTLNRAQSVLSKQLRSGQSFSQIPKAMNELTATLSVILDTAVFSTNDKSQLKAFLQQGTNDEDSPVAGGINAPVAAAYESHSSSILDTLATMQEKAEGMLAESRKTEMNAKHNFELLEQSLKNELSIQNNAMSSAKKALAASSEVKAQAEGDKAMTDKALAEDKAYLQDMTQNCGMRAEDAEASAKSRAEELNALKEAKKIISEMTGAAQTREYNLLQTSSRSVTMYDKAANSIKQLGKRDGNFLLTQLAQQIRTVEALTADPFAKVKKLVEQMITRLIKEAAEEADQKAFCDKELAENTKKRDSHQATVDKLSTRIEKASAGIATLKQQVSALQEELSNLAKSQAELISMRKNEHEEYVKSTQDYKDGLEGIRMGLKVLREYYAKAEGGGAFVQQPTVSMHARASNDSTGIISLLEVAESDFSRSLAEGESSESQAQEAFDKTSQDNRVAKATKESDVTYKTQEIGRIESMMSDAQADRDGTQEELDAVLEYLEKLRPQCTTKPISYEERKQRRENEIEGLKSALEVLENETVFTQTSSSFLALKTVHHH